MAQIYARPLPPVERMQEVQRLVRDPKETPMDTIKAAQLIKQARPPVAYTPRSLSQAASQAQLPVTPRPAPRPDPRLVPQPRVPANVPPPISPEDEAILMAQAGGRASIPQQVQNLASRGRHGDTMLMHVNPQEFQGLSTLLGPTTTNPDTGLPEAFAWWLPLVGAAIGGVGAAATGRDWKKGALIGGLAGLGGAGMMSLGGASTAAGGLGSTWGPFSGLLGGAGTTGAASGVANLGPYTGLVNPAVANVAGAGAPLGLTSTAAAQNAALSSVPHTMGMFGGVSPQAAIGKTAITNSFVPTISRGASYTPPNFLSPEKARALTAKNIEQQQDATSSSSLLGRAWDWMKENPKETAAGAYGISSLLGSQQGYPPYTAPPIRKPVEFDISDIPPKELRRAKKLTEEEIEKQKLEGGTGSFLEGTDQFTEPGFASGGIVGLYGGGPPPGQGAAAYTQVLPGSIEYRQKHGKFFPTNYHPHSNPYGDPIREPVIEEAPQPFTFDNKDPFATRISNFNAQDALSRIAGPSIPVTTNTIPANIPVPPPALDPVALNAGQGALADLLNRASQSSFADVGGIQEALEQPSVIQNNTGGLLSILSNRDQRNKFDPIAAVSPIYAFKEGKYPEYYMPLKMIQGLATGGGFATGYEFAGHVQGVGDGMSDQIPFRVVPQTPQDIPNAPDMAVLSTDEYVFPADAVAMLGNGSSDAGAKILDSAVKNVRRASIGTPKQIKQIDGQKVLEGAMTT